MKTKIDVVSGFLGAGKTTYICSGLKSEEFSKGRTVLIQYESGEEEIEEQHIKGRDIYIEAPVNGRVPDESCLKDILIKYKPSRIIIECNGMEKTEGILNLFDSSFIRRNFVINKITNIVDASTYELFMSNMGAILREQIENSDNIVIRNTQGVSEDKLASIKDSLKSMNSLAVIEEAAESSESAFTSEDEEDEEELLNKLSGVPDKLFAGFCFVIAAYLAYMVSRTIGFRISSEVLGKLEAFNTVFISILLQAFPFILFGVLVSSGIQVFVSRETVIKYFPKNTALGFIAAIFAGLLFPVCDCAIVPVASRLSKKGVPLPAVVTFMLAAPIVNPIVIASTLYAFPGQPYITLYRVYLGVAIAIITGLILMIFPGEKGALLDGKGGYMCKCGCEDDYSGKALKDKLNAIMRHAGEEFIDVGRFMIAGALLSSIVQVFVPKNAITAIGGGNIVSLLIMMLAAFILSVCSSSDAFIARTFTSQFSMSSVMGFLVLGPMLDIKNLLMLMGSYRKSFVIKLVLIIFGVSFAVLSFFSTILF